jgi:hypothetical protein
MGRMADLWKVAESSALTPPPRSGALLTLDPVAAPELGDDDDVPFIEVGGPQPVMRHLESIAPTKSHGTAIGSQDSGIRNQQSAVRSQIVGLASQSRKSADRISPAFSFMTVRFEAVRASHLAGRGFGAELVAFHQPDHAVSVMYRSLVAEIMTQLPGAKPRALLIVSALPGVGASTVVLNLGVTLARHGDLRVTLVDGHFAHPDLAERLGLPPSPGLRDVLARKMPLAWAVQETQLASLFALTAGRDDAPPAAALAPIVEQLRLRSDWLLIDAGPWDERLLPLAEACDALYLVHAEGDAAAREIVSSILGTTGRLRGCVITKR